MVNKKIIVLLVFAALGGGIIGSLISADFVSANIFQDIYNNFLKPLDSPIANNSLAIQTQSNLYQPNISYEQAIIDAVQKSSPSVVSIIISKDVPVIEECPYSPFSNLPLEFQQLFGEEIQLYQSCQKGTEVQEVGGGSGFIISSDGMILTNKHVVLDKSASYTVLTNDGKKYPATVLAQDPAVDLAIVKIDVSGLPVLPLGDSDGLRLGQSTIAIGNALGEFRNTVSVGVISGLARNITASGNGITENIEGVIQTDSAINAGNSGGPLLNLKGEAIGINVAMVLGAQNISFALPINQAKKAIDSVKRTGKIETPFLGVRYVPVDADFAKEEKLSAVSGVVIKGDNEGPAVIKDSPADRAGIRANDIILEINGTKISQDVSLKLLIQKYNVGDTINLKILRGGKEIGINVKLENRI